MTQRPRLMLLALPDNPFFLAFNSSGLELCSLPPRLHFPSLIHPRLSSTSSSFSAACTSEVVLRLCSLAGGVLLYHQLLRALLVLLGSGGSLLGLVAAELLLGLGLDGLVGSLDGGSALDGGGAEVRAVAVLGDLVGNSLVGPFGMTVSAVQGMFCFSPFSQLEHMSKNLLAVGLDTVVGGLGGVLGGLVGLSLLGGDDNGTLLAGGDTNGL